jgi:hypothetical protein
MAPSDQEPVFVPAAASPAATRETDAAPATAPTEPPFEFPEAENDSPTATQAPFETCTDDLTFLGDLTYPDRTPVLAGQPLEKRWKVRNSGQCDWGPEYRFRWIGGTALSTQQEFALYPAVAGSEAVLSVLMTAPFAPGEYVSDWRAFSPLGVPFGDTLYIDVVVSA